MTHPTYLNIYRDLLTNDGSFILKHDSRDFFLWSLEQLVHERWHIKELTFDLHDCDLASDYKIMTTYEARWTDEGRSMNLVRATPMVQ